MKIIVLFVIATIFAVPAICVGQGGLPDNDKPDAKVQKKGAKPTVNPRRPSAARTSSASAQLTARTVAQMSRQVKMLKPAIDDATLVQDKAVVARALPEIKYEFSRQGFEVEDAVQATLAAWLLIRSSNLFAGFTVEVLTQYVDGLGKLNVDSDPTGADADIRAAGIQVYNDQTVAKVWLSAGTYVVKLSKPSCDPIEEAVEVKRGKKTDFKRTLICHQ